jgi:phage-related protein
MSALLGGIVWSIQALGNLALGVLSISYRCGSVIVSGGQAVFSTAVSIISTLAEVVSILYKDFCIFSYDVLSKAIDAASFCTYLVSGLFSVVKSTFLTARDCILFVVQSFTDGLSFGFNNMSQVNFLQVKKITNKSFKYLF